MFNPNAVHIPHNSISAVPFLKLKQISNDFEFENEQRVKQYLLKNPEIIDLLISITDVVSNEFNYPLTLLEHVHDQENENWESLLIKIKTAYPLDIADKKIDLLLDLIYNSGFRRTDITISAETM